MYRKKRFIQKITFISVLCMVLMFCSFTSIYAATPYSSFTYDSYGNAVLSPNLYEPEKIVYGSSIGVGVLINPQDLFITKNGDIYILDTGNDRIVIVDKNYKLVQIIDQFFMNGILSPLKSPQGIFVDDKKNIYIADTGNNRVACINENGTIYKEITKPSSDYITAGTDFVPMKLTIDRAHNMYIQATGIYKGLIIIDNDFVFQGFFGSEEVVTSTKLLTDYFWKEFMTPEQKARMAAYVPTEIQNIDISDRDFIYTITNASYIPSLTEDVKISMDIIRKLNPSGKNTLIEKMPVNAKIAMQSDAKEMSFIDICFDESGFVNIVDKDKGKIFQFDENMNLVTAFGTFGNYSGGFIVPAAIDTYEQKILVLDSRKGSITVFRLTEFGSKVHNAFNLYNKGKYEAAIEPWKEVLNLDTNYELAYNAIGSALYNNQKYKEAMDYFELGRNSVKYDEAYREYRVIEIRSHFNYVILSIVLLVLLYFSYKKRRLIVDKIAKINIAATTGNSRK